MNLRRHWMEQHRMPLESMEVLSARASRRRLVLLGEEESVIAEPPAHLLHAELRRLMAMYGGLSIGGEYLKDGKWVRFLVGRKA